jgi:hypothetical protein
MKAPRIIQADLNDAQCPRENRSRYLGELAHPSTTYEQ